MVWRKDDGYDRDNDEDDYHDDVNMMMIIDSYDCDQDHDADYVMLPINMIT